MSLVIIEQEFSSPLTADDIVRPSAKTRSCMELYGANPRHHYLARGGLYCMCAFDAPDAESVRSAYRLADGGPPKGIWAASIHPEGRVGAIHAPVRQNPDLTLVLTERVFADPVSYAEVRSVEEVGALSGDLRAVRFLRSYFSSNRKRLVCVYEAPDVESVTMVSRHAGLTFERAWSAELVVH
jgi:hypothetical protein